MANRYFGEIDDVWTHLLLAEILSIELPREYWESHAGAARCPVSPSPQRSCGVDFFVQAADQSPALVSRSYVKQLQNLMTDGALQFYPGSPWLAMNLLGPEIRRYLFCGTDAESLQNIVAFTHEARLPEDRVQCVQDDGVSILRGAGIILMEHWAPSTLAFLDARQIARSSLDGGITPVDIFCELSNRGIKSVLSYQFAGDSQRQACHDTFAAATQKHRLSQERHHFCRFEIAPKNSGTAPAILSGLGLWCSNLSPAAIATCQKLGPAMVDLYKDAKLPDGSSGALAFESHS